MLVIDDSAYGMGVPIQIGTLHIDEGLLSTDEGIICVCVC